jgi:HlyD family secretion protein
MKMSFNNSSGYRSSLNLSLSIVLMVLVACNGGNGKSDAYGNFEADEVVVSAENNGVLIDFQVDEGDRLKAGQEVALIDTVLPSLNLQQLNATLSSVEARLVQLQKNIDVQEERLKVLKKEADRVTNLHNENAISSQKFDEVTGQYDIARKELEQIRSQRLALLAEQKLNKAKIAAAKEQLNRCRVAAPITGTVLQKYAEKGEFATVGKPLFKMAETNELILRAYISGSQLDDVKIGQEVTVRFDKNEKSEHETKGRVSWVSSSAEFTPKIIQTKEERVDLVYAIKVIVPNDDGKLKIGMPGEVIL